MNKELIELLIWAYLDLPDGPTKVSIKDYLARNGVEMIASDAGAAWQLDTEGFLGR